MLLEQPSTSGQRNLLHGDLQDRTIRLAVRSPSAKYGSTAYFKQFSHLVAEDVGEPIFFEVWNDGTIYDELVGGFVIYPTLPKVTLPGEDPYSQEYVAKILWDWKGKAGAKRPGTAHVAVRMIPAP